MYRPFFNGSTEKQWVRSAFIHDIANRFRLHCAGLSFPSVSKIEATIIPMFGKWVTGSTRENLGNRHARKDKLKVSGDSKPPIVCM